MQTASSVLYLDLLKKTLSRYLAPEEFREIKYQKGSWQHAITGPLRFLLDRKGYLICERAQFDAEARERGEDWPAQADTMIGLKRLDNLQECISHIVRDGVPGDFIETGVWRGGACIFMRGVLEALDEPQRCVWVADSFEGLPKPSLDTDKKWKFWRYRELAVSVEDVQANFRKYGLLDNRVKFLKGWFKDTLPTAPIGTLALARLDGDLYESTWDAISALYPKLSVGGFLIVDDYGGISSCREAIDTYRAQHHIGDPILKIDNSGVFWRKTAAAGGLAAVSKP